MFSDDAQEEDEETEGFARDPDEPDPDLEDYVPPKLVNWLVCRNPEEDEEYDRDIREEFEERYDPKNGSALVDLPDRAAHHVPKLIAEFYDYLEKTTEMLHDDDAVPLIAKKYNAEIYGADQDMGERGIGVRKLTRSDLRRHLRKTLHLQPERMVRQLILEQRRDASFIRANHMYVERTVNGERSGRMEMVDAWKKRYDACVLTIERLLVTQQKLKLQERGNGGDFKLSNLSSGTDQTFEDRLKYDAF